MPCSKGANGITHILSDQAGWLDSLVGLEFPQLPLLLNLGAVYHQKKRIRQNTWVEKGDYLRIHPNPRRFAVHNCQWSQRVVFEGSDFLIVNKPAGIPSIATVDNSEENTVCALEATLGTALFVTHRLDHATSGLMLIAKTAERQAWFNRRLAKRQVVKTYLALSETAPSPSLLTHYLEESDRLPKQMETEMRPGWRECLTQIVSTSSVGRFFETELRPLTGRTHQLRAQMAKEGHPLLGDALYGGKEIAPFDPQHIALHSHRLAFSLHPDLPQCFEISPPWRT